MATRSQIEFDFKKALGQADKIEGIAVERIPVFAERKYLAGENRCDG